MKILITGICGFVGCAIAQRLKAQLPHCELVGMDNFIRPGSEQNRARLKALGVTLVHGDIRLASDLEPLPAVDWVIDAAANPSVLAGVDGKTSSRQLVEHNLVGTFNILETCKRIGAGLILLSTSRVYSISGLAGLRVGVEDHAFVPDPEQPFPAGISLQGVSEAYTTQSPISLYGASKVASEVLSVEYGSTFGFPVRINRCGVLAGAGQFGRPDQGILSYWIHSWKHRKPLKYIGFDGQGHQVRDCLHPADLASLLVRQLETGQDSTAPAIVNVSGGPESAISLRQLSDWCASRFGAHEVGLEPTERPFDIPWMVLDSSLARQQWDWRPQRSLTDILEEIADHAEANPDWLGISAPL
jgi:CDP-paratose 2-epimerase